MISGEKTPEQYIAGVAHFVPTWQSSGSSNENNVRSPLAIIIGKGV